MKVNRNDQDDRYSTVRYNIRELLDISLVEYCFCDIVYHLSASRKSRVNGWACAKNNYYTGKLGIKARALRDLKNRVITRGLMERHPDHIDLLRTTLTWEEAHQEGKLPDWHEKEDPADNAAHQEDPAETASPPAETADQDRQKLPPEPAETAANSNLDSYLSDSNDDNGQPPTPGTLPFYQKRIQDLGIKNDTPVNRSRIWQIVRLYLNEQEFKDAWELIAGINAEKINPAELVREWISQGKNWHQIKTLQINKISSWVQIHLRDQQKYQSNGSNTAITGQPTSADPNSF